MKRYSSIQLRWGIPIIILGAFSLMMVTSSMWRYQHQTTHVEQRTNEFIKERLANLQHLIEGLLRANQGEFVAEAIADFGSNLDVNSLALVDEQERVIYASQRIWLGKAMAEVMPEFDRNNFNDAINNRRLIFHSDQGGDRILAYQPLSLAVRPGEIRPYHAGVLLLDYSLVPARTEIQQEMQVQALSIFLSGGAAVILLMLALQYWLARPLNYLREAVTRISQGDLSTQIVIGGQGELAELGSAVDKMRNDLANSNAQILTSLRMLRARERELIKITDTMPGPISRFDLSGRYLFASAAMQDWFGQSSDEVIGQYHRDVIGANLYTIYEPHIKRALTGEQLIFEAQIPKERSGGMRDAIVTMLPDLDDGGRVCGYYTICVDITDHKRAEERFRYAVEAAPNAMIMVDEKGIMVLINSRTSAMFGYTRDELIGQSINLLLPMSYHAAHTKYVKEFIAHPSARAMGAGRELHGRHKYGHEIPVDVGLNPLQTNEGLFIIASVIDISERKLAIKKLQEKNAELERYSVMVSHDLKSPLVTIKTFLGYLKQDMAKGDTVRIEKDMDFMSNAATKMGQLLDELLEMSRIGRKITLPVNLAWRDAVKEALAINAGAISQRGVVVTIDDADVIFLGEAPRLIQIWHNLIDNAVKFMGDQPEPTIRVGVEHGLQGTVFYVCDNGIGVDPRYRNKIFGMFEKLDANAPGSGLGLALVQRIVQLYRGEIWVDSKGTGHGACFRFTLPEALKNEKQEVIS